MEATSGTKVYSDDRNNISDTQAVLNGKTFALADINTISYVPPVLRPEYGYVLAAVGVVIFIAGYLVWGVFLTPMLAGAVFLIVGLAVAFAVRKTHTIRVTDTAAKVTEVDFTDRKRAQNVYKALNEALNRKHAKDGD